MNKIVDRLADEIQDIRVYVAGDDAPGYAYISWFEAENMAKKVLTILYEEGLIENNLVDM